MPEGSPQEEKRYIFKISPLSVLTRHASQQQRPQQQQQQAHTEEEREEQKEDAEPSSKRQKHSPGNSITLPLRPIITRSSSRPSIKFTPHSFTNNPKDLDDMSDGSMNRNPARRPAAANIESENEARALRVMEIMNDFRTLQSHIASLVTRPDANPPDQASYYLTGYALLRECNALAQAVLGSTNYNPGNLGLGAGSSRVPETEVHRATLQRIILDASTRRFQAHKIYLRAAAGMRWVQLRQQARTGNLSPGRRAEALAAIDTRLQQELGQITDEKVVDDLRAADRRNRYWLAEDPSLERMLAWIRRSQSN